MDCWVHARGCCATSAAATCPACSMEAAMGMTKAVAAVQVMCRASSWLPRVIDTNRVRWAAARAVPHHAACWDGVGAVGMLHLHLL